MPRTSPGPWLRRGTASPSWPRAAAITSTGLLYPASQLCDGVRVIRAGRTRLGKTRKWKRAVDFASFLLVCFWRTVRLPAADLVIAMTTPPLLSIVAALATRLKGGALHIWMMDMNPDEAIAAGWLHQGSLVARFLEAIHRYSLRKAERIYVLDRFMQARIEAKGIAADRIRVIPPWAHDLVHWDPEGREAFRQEHGLAGKFVVMYAGNHSHCHPLDSLLEAARRLRAHADIVFCFVGGGSGFAKVQEFLRRHDLHNILCLPYQPLDRLSASLSAADLHAVVMGDPFVGIVHPSKVYHAMALGIPVLYVGPAGSHITDLGPADWLLTACHGDVAGLTRHILNARSRGPRRYEDELLRAGEFAQRLWVPRMVAAVCGPASRAPTPPESVRSPAHHPRCQTL